MAVCVRVWSERSPPDAPPTPWGWGMECAEPWAAARLWGRAGEAPGKVARCRRQPRRAGPGAGSAGAGGGSGPRYACAARRPCRGARGRRAAGPMATRQSCSAVILCRADSHPSLPRCRTLLSEGRGGGWEAFIRRGNLKRSFTALAQARSVLVPRSVWQAAFKLSPGFLFLVSVRMPQFDSRESVLIQPPLLCGLLERRSQPQMPRAEAAAALGDSERDAGVTATGWAVRLPHAVLSSVKNSHIESRIQKKMGKVVGFGGRSTWHNYVLHLPQSGVKHTDCLEDDGSYEME